MLLFKEGTPTKWTSRVSSSNLLPSIFSALAAVAVLGVSPAPVRAQGVNTNSESSAEARSATQTQTSSQQWHVQPGQTQLSPEDAATFGESNTSSAAAAPANILSTNYEGITISQRAMWWAQSEFGPLNLLSGVITAGYQTGVKEPKQWGSGWGGFGGRYAMREVDVGLDNGIEASVGTLWGEDPRYFRVPQHAFGSRVKHGIVDAFEHRGRDGDYHPAYAYFVGNVSGNVINDAWHPSGTTTGADIGKRIGLGFVGKIAANEFHEFWPDVTSHVFHHGH